MFRMDDGRDNDYEKMMMMMMMMMTMMMMITGRRSKRRILQTLFEDISVFLL